MRFARTSLTHTQQMDDDVRASSEEPAAHRGPSSNAFSPTILSNLSTDTAIGSQRWTSPQLNRATTDSEIATSPRSNFDPEKASRATTFTLPRRESTITTLDEIDHAVHGYPRLATFMGHEPGAAIYRRFASLNARVLLYRQAELVCLEHELDELEKSFADQRDLHYSIKRLIHSQPGTTAERVWKKVQQIDVALERYSQYS